MLRLFIDRTNFEEKNKILPQKLCRTEINGLIASRIANVVVYQAALVQQTRYNKKIQIPFHLVKYELKNVTSKTHI